MDKTAQEPDVDLDAIIRKKAPFVLACRKEYQTDVRNCMIEAVRQALAISTENIKQLIKDLNHDPR